MDVEFMLSDTMEVSCSVPNLRRELMKKGTPTQDAKIENVRPSCRGYRRAARFSA